jgi:disulfide bond formation protein DsbB
VTPQAAATATQRAAPRRAATRRAGFAALVVLPLAAVGVALYTQYRLDMQPCAWCVLQRLIFIAVAVAALPGLLLPQRAVQRAAAALITVLAACGAAAALWLQFVAASSNSCAVTLAGRIVGSLGLDELWPEVFAAYASCADAAVKLFGVPYALYSLALFVVLGAIAVWLLLSPRRG